MKAPWFDYEAPASLVEALEILGDDGEDGRGKQQLSHEGASLDLGTDSVRTA